MKTKIKSHGDEVTDFYNNNNKKKNSKLDSNNTCLAIISLNSALKKDNNYYPQECKYIKKKVVRHINDTLSDFSSNDDEYDEE